jgi:Galactose oxidase, central domain
MHVKFEDSGNLLQVYSLSPDTWTWKEHTSEVQGDVPTPRSGHSAVALPGGRHLLLFGGGDASDDIYLSSLHILDTRTWHWSQVVMQVASPLTLPPCILCHARCCACMCGSLNPHFRYKDNQHSVLSLSRGVTLLCVLHRSWLEVEERGGRGLL